MKNKELYLAHIIETISKCPVFTLNSNMIAKHLSTELRIPHLENFILKILLNESYKCYEDLGKQIQDEIIRKYNEILGIVTSRKEKITKNWYDKMKSIFTLEESEDRDSDNSTQWWYNVVEVGWNPPAIKDIEDYINSSINDGTEDTYNVITNIIDNCSEEAITQLGLPIDTLQ
jgi:hypothetical protein